MNEPLTPEPATPTTRSGYVALIGKPNVGKSSIMNRLLGQKVSIVSPRAQTTRVPIRGILNREDAQIVFIDTPGIHAPNHQLGRLMVKLARQALAEADVIGFVVDISEAPTPLDRRVAQQVRDSHQPAILILNKVDLPPRSESHLEEYRSLASWKSEIAVSARRGDGLDALAELLASLLPQSERHFPEDWLSDQPDRLFAAEFIREQAFRHAQHEVPHATAVEIEEWEEREGMSYIRATIVVEREGQKAILIGKGGSMIKKIGSSARQSIEKHLQRPVYLDLRVKVRENWRDNPAALGWMGLTKDQSANTATEE